MIREFLRSYPYFELAVVGQLLFFTLFVGALTWVFRKGSKKFYQRLSLLPLENEGERRE